MKTKKDHVKRLLKYWREYYKEYESLFELKVEMIDHNICPKCGTQQHLSGGGKYEFNPCWSCGFSVTEWEWLQILDNKKGILKKKLRMAKVKK